MAVHTRSADKGTQLAEAQRRRARIAQRQKPMLRLRNRRRSSNSVACRKRALLSVATIAANLGTRMDPAYGDGRHWCGCPLLGNPPTRKPSRVPGATGLGVGSDTSLPETVPREPTASWSGATFDNKNLAVGL